MRALSQWILATVLIAAATSAAPAQKLKVLLIDGQNNHNYRATTPVVQQALESTGRFTVEVVSTPSREAPRDDWNGFRPDFTKFNVVLSNYNGQDWPAEVQQALEKYMAGGGGLVIYHAANNPFPTWTEWTKMVGLCWQGPGFGDRITMDDSGKVVRTPKGEGPGAGHGPQHPYEMTVRDAAHPIMKGLPAKWTHAADELYHGQRGPAVNMHILVTAFSAQDKGGTGTNEPLVYVIRYGRGRVFVCLLGHDVPQTSAPDTELLLARGAEWAATGRVTLPVPKQFPGL